MVVSAPPLQRIYPTGRTRSYAFTAFFLSLDMCVWHLIKIAIGIFQLELRQKANLSLSQRQASCRYRYWILKTTYRMSMTQKVAWFLFFAAIHSEQFIKGFQVWDYVCLQRRGVHFFMVYGRGENITKLSKFSMLVRKVL